MAPPSTSSYSKYATHHRTPNPKKSALLIIDMQNYFSSIAKPILPSLNSTISLARAHRIPVIFTRHLTISPQSQPRNMLAEWWPDLIMGGTFESELLPTLDRDPSDPVVEKETYSAFRGTGLEERLREMGIEEVIVAGVMTNLCCETTAREAFVRGFRVFFCADATGTVCEEMQNATLLNLGHGFAYLVDCQSLRKMGN